MEQLLIAFVVFFGMILIMLLIALLISVLCLRTSLSELKNTVRQIALALASNPKNPVKQGGQAEPCQESAAPAPSAATAPASPFETAIPPPLPPVFQITPTPPAPKSPTPPKENAKEEPFATPGQSATADEQTTSGLVGQCVPQGEPTAFEHRIRMLRNWFLYGRTEGVPAGEDVERLMATTWLLRCGILVILFTSAFLLKLSIERGILAPPGRVILSYLAGASVLLAGLTRRMRQRYWSMGQALCGLGLGVFYFSSFAMTSMYHLVSATIGGAVMCLTTVTAGALAERLDSISIAMVAMAGGYATPLLLNTEAWNFPGLAAYLLLLGLGVLWLAIRRNWPPLSWLAMIFTYGIYCLTISTRYAQGDFAVCQTALVLFFMLFSTTVFIHNVRRNIPATALEIFALLANSAIFFGISWRLIGKVNHGERLLFAPLTLGLAAYYLLHAAVLARRRETAPRNLLRIFCALSGLYLALTFPVVLSEKWLASAWSMQAFTMLWLGYRMESRLLKNCAWCLYAMTIGHLAVCDFWCFRSMALSAGETTWQELVSRLFQYLVPVASLAVAARLTTKANESQADSTDQGPPPALGLESGSPAELLAGGLLGLAFVALFLFLLLEEALCLRANRIHWLAGVNLVWVGGCMAALQMLKRRMEGWWQAILAILLGAIVMRSVSDFLNPLFWRWDTPQFLWGDCIGALANTSVLAMGFALCARQMPKGRMEQTMGRVCQLAWPVLLFVHLTREWSIIIKYKLPGLTGGGVSVLWGMFAFALVFRGLRKPSRWLRYLGLGLFTVVVCKVFLFDMGHLDALYRVMAFFLAGALLMGAAFVYLKFWHNSNSGEKGAGK